MSHLFIVLVELEKKCKQLQISVENHAININNVSCIVSSIQQHPVHMFSLNGMHLDNFFVSSLVCYYCNRFLWNMYWL